MDIENSTPDWPSQGLEDWRRGGDLLLRSDFWGAATSPITINMPVVTDLQHFAADAHRILPSHLVDPGVPRSVSCAKYAAAFFAMSRSILRRATSALSLASSICSGDTVAAFAVPAPWVSPSLASWRTQLLRLALGMPSTRATSPTERPSSPASPPPA